jgi:hypothetical protein
MMFKKLILAAFANDVLRAKIFLNSPDAIRLQGGRVSAWMATM